MEPPIFGFNGARASILDEVVSRACEAVGDARLALSEAAFLEVRRQQQPSSGIEDVMALGEWRAPAPALRGGEQGESPPGGGAVATPDPPARPRDLRPRPDPVPPPA